MPLSAKMFFLEQRSPMEEGGSHIMLEHCVCGKKNMLRKVTLSIDEVEANDILAEDIFFPSINY